MGPRLLQHYRSRSASYARSPDADAPHGSPGPGTAAAANALDCPFAHVDGLSRADAREAAYEVFFMSCRAGGSAKGAAAWDGGGAGDASPTIGAGPRGGTGMNVVNSRVKRALGLKARRASQPSTALRSGGVNASSSSSAPGSPGRAMRAASGSPRARRPMTSAEIMRQQMRVTEQGDARLRKTLMRTLVGQVGRRAETIILPLELLRQLKLPDFADSAEHHQWQRRQLKLLEAGLILHSSVPLDHRHSASVLRFREVLEAAEARAIDTGKASDAMRALCDAVLALAWRSAPAGEACHWADGYPLNVTLYVSLLQGIFDLRDETVVLDEVDELLELMKRTWSTLGINRMLHNVCFAWVLFQQYVATGQVEPDLAGATLAVLTEVATDAGARQENPRDPVYAQVLSTALGAIRDWSEKRLLDYHEWYGNGGTGTAALECALSLALAAGKIIAESVHTDQECGGDRVDYYIRCSMRSAFTKVLESGLRQEDVMVSGGQRDVDDSSQILTRLARDTEELAQWEREGFSVTLRRWHPFPAAVAAVTLHGCYGVVLKRYLGKASCLTDELVRALHAAGRLEKALMHMAMEDVNDGGESVVREVVPYDVESVVVSFLRTWVEERLRVANECLLRAKDTESWISRSKNEPYAQSAVDLMKLAKATMDEFFAIPVSARDGMLQDLADGFGAVFHDYVAFLASCGNKQSYLPALPALTRCNQDSTIKRLWKRAAVAPCRVPLTSGRGNAYHGGGQSASAAGGHNPRPSTSRGTQRLYVRLNTLHYILSHIQAFDKSLSFFSAGGGACASPSATSRLRAAPCCHFDHARAAAQSAVTHVAEVAAYRLIFFDSHHSFYDGLYAGGVGDARIRPALRTLKQNLSVLVSVLVDRAQPVAVREVMKASFHAFLTVVLAGGNHRSFTREDHEMVEEDLRSLKRAFCTRGEGLVAEEVVESEAEAAEGVVALMGQTAERLVEELGTATATSCGGSPRAALPMPLTTRRWCRTDPDTILRVLCHRDDEAASQFLKRAFQLPKRR